MNLQTHYQHPTAFVIFGGTGDLAQTKLLPALFHLYVAGRLPQSFIVLGLSRKEMSDEEYRAYARGYIKTDNVDALEKFLPNISYRSGSFDSLHLYDELKRALQEFDSSIGQCTSKLFYLAVPPSLYSGIFARLKESNAMALCDDVSSWSRLLVEKPFGNDIQTAEALEAQLCELFTEDQIYRIDHYLAKDAIENILSLRFSNSLLSGSWTGQSIESIDIELKESKDVANRGVFYDGIGTLRDVGQNHILQMLALLTMDAVDIADAHAVRKSRAQLLSWLAVERVTEAARGQYLGYREVEGVKEGSETETYFKIVTTLGKDSWKHVPITLSSGKALSESSIDATILFRNESECHCAFESSPHYHKNVLHIVFAPSFSVSLTLWVKRPGFDATLLPRELVLVEDVGSDIRSPEAYEKVLFDCITGDQRRFVSGDEVKASWEFITPLLARLQQEPLLQYNKGSSEVVKD